MAALLEEPESSKRLTSLKTNAVKKLVFSTDINRNRVAHEVWDATFRAQVGTHYSRMLDEEPPSLSEFYLMFPTFAPEQIAASYANALQTWEIDSQLVSAAIISTCDFDGDDTLGCWTPFLSQVNVWRP